MFLNASFSTLPSAIEICTRLCPNPLFLKAVQMQVAVFASKHLNNQLKVLPQCDVITLVNENTY